MVRISADALGHGPPETDLPKQFTIYLVETENNDVILANGAPSESFIYAAYLALNQTDRIFPEMPLPRISSWRLFASVE